MGEEKDNHLAQLPEPPKRGGLLSLFKKRESKALDLPEAQITPVMELKEYKQKASQLEKELKRKNKEIQAKDKKIESIIHNPPTKFIKKRLKEKAAELYNKEDIIRQAARKLESEAKRLKKIENEHNRKAQKLMEPSLKLKSEIDKEKSYVESVKKQTIIEKEHNSSMVKKLNGFEATLKRRESDIASLSVELAKRKESVIKGEEALNARLKQLPDIEKKEFARVRIRETELENKTRQFNDAVRKFYDEQKSARKKNEEVQAAVKHVESEAKLLVESKAALNKKAQELAKLEATFGERKMRKLAQDLAQKETMLRQSAENLMKQHKELSIQQQNAKQNDAMLKEAANEVMKREKALKEEEAKLLFGRKSLTEMEAKYASKVETELKDKYGKKERELANWEVRLVSMQQEVQKAKETLGNKEKAVDLAAKQVAKIPGLHRIKRQLKKLYKLEEKNRKNEAKRLAEMQKSELVHKEKIKARLIELEKTEEQANARVKAKHIALENREAENNKRIYELKAKEKELIAKAKIINDANNRVEKEIDGLNDKKGITLLEKTKKQVSDLLATKDKIDQQISERQGMLKQQENDIADKIKGINRWNAEVGQRMKELEERALDLKDKESVLIKKMESLDEREKLLENNRQGWFAKRNELLAELNTIKKQANDANREKVKVQDKLLKDKQQLSEIDLDYDTKLKALKDNAALLKERETEVIDMVRDVEEDTALLKTKEVDILEQVANLEEDEELLGKRESEIIKKIRKLEIEEARYNKLKDTVVGKEQALKAKEAELKERIVLFTKDEKELEKRLTKVSAAKEMKMDYKELKAAYKKLKAQYNEIEGNLLKGHSLREKDRELQRLAKELLQKEQELKSIETQVEARKSQIDDMMFKNYVGHKFELPVKAKTEMRQQISRPTKAETAPEAKPEGDIYTLIDKTRKLIENKQLEAAKKNMVQMAAMYNSLKLDPESKSTIYYYLLDLRNEIKMAEIEKPVYDAKYGR